MEEETKYCPFRRPNASISSPCMGTSCGIWNEDACCCGLRLHIAFVPEHGDAYATYEAGIESYK